MNKEPIALYLFRFVLGLGLFAFMGMLYWSSELVEQDLRYLKQEFQTIQVDLDQMRSQNQRMERELLQTLIRDQKDRQALVKAIQHNQNEIQHIEKKLTSLPTQDLASNIKKIPTHPNTQKSQKEAVIQLSDSDNKFENNIEELSEEEPLLLANEEEIESVNLLNEDPFYQKSLPNLLGDSWQAQGTLRSAMVGKPDNLHPFNNFRSVSSLIGRCTVSIAEAAFGKYEEMTPGMAEKLEIRKNEKTGREEFWVTLRDHVYWQPLEKKHFPEDFFLAVGTIEPRKNYLNLLKAFHLILKDYNRQEISFLT